MALDVDVFTAYALRFVQEELETAFPNVLRARSITHETLDDGSVRTTIQEEHGPASVDRDQIRPMLRGIGRAIVELLQNHAEVPITDVAAGASTRTGRIE